VLWTARLVAASSGTSNGGGLCLGDLLDFANETESAPMQRSDEELIGPIVAQRPSGAIDPTGERSFRDDAPIPDSFDQLILADDPVVIAHQMDNQVKNLGFCVNRKSPMPQFMLADIKFEVRKSVFHYHSTGR